MTDKETKKELEEAVKILKEECEHSTLSGYCLEHNEMCFYEDQTLCPDYFPKYSLNYTNIGDKK